LFVFDENFKCKQIKNNTLSHTHTRIHTPQHPNKENSFHATDEGEHTKEEWGEKRKREEARAMSIIIVIVIVIIILIIIIIIIINTIIIA